MLGIKHEQMEALRAQIAADREAPRAGRRRRPRCGRTKEPGLLGAPGGLLHEVFADERRNGGAALGFALAQARGLHRARNGRRCCSSSSCARRRRWACPMGWGSRASASTPTAWCSSGSRTITELLWAIEEAIACRAVAAVVADIASPPKALDFTASRRLSLRAAGRRHLGVPHPLRARGARRAPPGCAGGCPPASAAPSPFDARAPGGPRWRVELEKGRLSAAQRAGQRIIFVDWTENGFVVVDSSTEGTPAARGARAATSRCSCRAGRPTASGELIRSSPRSTGRWCCGSASRGRCGWWRSTRWRRGAGLSPDQNLSDARALVPDLEVREIDHAFLEQVFADFADWHSNASPIVSVLTDQAALRRSLPRHHRGRPSVRRRGEACSQRSPAGCEALGFTVMGAIAPSVGAAWALAHFDPGRVLGGDEVEAGARRRCRSARCG